MGHLFNLLVDVLFGFLVEYLLLFPRAYDFLDYLHCANNYDSISILKSECLVSLSGQGCLVRITSAIAIVAVLINNNKSNVKDRPSVSNRLNVSFIILSFN